MANKGPREPRRTARPAKGAGRHPRTLKGPKAPAPKLQAKRSAPKQEPDEAVLAGLGVSPAAAVRRVAEAVAEGKPRAGTRKAARKRRGKGTKGGQAPHEPTPDQRRQVATMRGVGLTHEQVAIIIGVSVDTLTRHYAADLDRGMAEAHFQVAGALFTAARAGAGWATTFWLRHRAGWSDKTVVQHEGRVIVEHAEAADAAAFAAVAAIEAELVRQGYDGPGDG